MFFSNYEKLCAERGEKPYALPLKLGAKSNSMVAQWKNGSVPRPDMLQKIADYFGVSVGHLLGYDEQKNKPTTDGSELSRDILLNALEGTDDMSTLLAALDVINKKLQERR